VTDNFCRGLSVQVLNNEQQMTKDEQQKLNDKDLQLLMNHVELKMMEVCCNNHKEQNRVFKRVSRECSCSEKSAVNGWYSDADQVQNIHNLYTQILVSDWQGLSNTKPERGLEVLTKWKYEMHMSFKCTRTSMNKDNKEHMYQGTWKGFRTWIG
jgi:hypothetical protein